jgi:hypothetical protein
MFIVTVSDVVAGVALILLVVGGTALWVWVTLVDRKTRKRCEAEKKP